jgi:ribosomal protein L4
MVMKLKVANGGEPNSRSRTRISAMNTIQALVFQVVNAYLAAGRSGTKAQKTRAEVRGGGQQAACAEGHRFRARRLDQEPDLGRRWARVCCLSRATSRKR